MPKGLPRSIIKKYGISKKAWDVYRGRKGKKRTSKSRRSSNPKRSVKRTARRKRRRRASMTLPVAPLIGFAAPFAMTNPSGRTIIGDAMKGNYEDLLYDARERFTGIDANGKFHGEWVVATYLPMILGGLIHKYVGGSPINLNRTLGRAKIPLIRI